MTSNGFLLISNRREIKISAVSSARETDAKRRDFFVFHIFIYSYKSKTKRAMHHYEANPSRWPDKLSSHTIRVLMAFSSQGESQSAGSSAVNCTLCPDFDSP